MIEKLIESAIQGRDRFVKLPTGRTRARRTVRSFRTPSQKCCIESGVCYQERSGPEGTKRMRLPEIPGPDSDTESAGKAMEGDSKTMIECKLPKESEKVKGKAKEEYHETSFRE